MLNGETGMLRGAIKAPAAHAPPAPLALSWPKIERSIWSKIARDAILSRRLKDKNDDVEEEEENSQLWKVAYFLISKQ